MTEQEQGPEEQATPEQAAEALSQAVETVREHRGSLKGAGLAGILGGMVLGRARRTIRRPRLGRRRLRRLGFGLLIVVLSVATCSFGVDPSTLTASYGDPVPSSAEAATRVLTRGAQVLQRAPDAGAVRLTLTESEATSALSLGMMLPELMMAANRIPPEEIQQARDLEALRERIWREADAQLAEIAGRSSVRQRILMKLDPRIRTGDVQVRFEESGEVVVAGFVQAWRFRLPGLFVVAPRAQGGEMDLDFVSGRLGRMPLPELAFDWMGGLVASAILLGQDYAEVSEISVGDGTLTFEGRLTGG